MALIDLRQRAPTIERLPDLRLRVTRVYDVVNFTIFIPAQIAAKVWLPWGTADSVYTSTRLIKQDVTGQHPAGSGERGDPTMSPERHPCLLTRVYEQIDASLETSVGNADVSIGDDGITTVTDSSIQFSTGTAIYGVPGVTTAPAPWTTLILKNETRTDDGELRNIKRTYVSKGLLKQSEAYHNNGQLHVQSYTYLNQIPPTPSGYTLINTSLESPNGLPVYTYEFARGFGVIDKRIQQRDGGLRLETWVSLGTAYVAATMQPGGILMMKDVEEVDGMERYTATCMQNAAGGDPVVGTALSYNTKHPFRYPGRAKAYKKNIPSIYGSNSSGVASFTTSAYNVFRSPPVDVEVDAQVDISYGTALGVISLGTTFWNPLSWATYEAIFQKTGTIMGQNIVESLYGYRAINAGTALPFTAGSTIVSFGAGTIDVTAYVTSCLGQPVYQLSSGSITVYGGPIAPDGLTWVLDAKNEEAFSALDGTRYFRRSQVSATIPAQDALPY